MAPSGKRRVSGSAEGRSPFARRPQTAELSAPQGSGAQPAPTQAQRSDPQHSAANGKTPDPILRRGEGNAAGVGAAERQRPEAGTKGGAAREGRRSEPRGAEPPPDEHPLIVIRERSGAKGATETERARMRAEKEPRPAQNRESFGLGCNIGTARRAVPELQHVVITQFSQFCHRISRL